MTSPVCKSAQGIGVTPFHCLPEEPKYFTEVSIAETVKIPLVKPDIEDLVSVAVEAEVISVRLINTAEGHSDECQHLSGRKLIVELKLKQKVKYVADEPTQSVHAAHFEKVISSVFIVVPPVVTHGSPPCPIPIEMLFRQGHLVVTPYIEDIYAVARDKRTIFKNITVFVDVKICHQP